MYIMLFPTADDFNLHQSGGASLQVSISDNISLTNKIGEDFALAQRSYLSTCEAENTRYSVFLNFEKS